MVVLIRIEIVKKGLDSGWIFFLFLRGNLYTMKYIHAGVHFYIFWPICVTTTNDTEISSSKKSSLVTLWNQNVPPDLRQPPICLLSLYIRYVFSIASYALELHLISFFVSGFFFSLSLFLKFTCVYACITSPFFFIAD